MHAQCGPYPSALGWLVGKPKARQRWCDEMECVFLSPTVLGRIGQRQAFSFRRAQGLQEGALRQFALRASRSQVAATSKQEDGVQSGFQLGCTPSCFKF